jgi:3-oxoacyl-[acyl-carrier-protein] synthase-3
MNGREVFRHAVTALAEASLAVLDAAGMTIADLDWMVPHQANIRILHGVAKRLELPLEKLLVTVDRHANTSAASIPLALADAAAAGQLERDQLLVMNAIGGGLSWGAALVRW